jgi:CO/xanthine dehydrogenase Mo-binding subunit
MQLTGGLDKDNNLIAFESKLTAAPGPQWTEFQLGPVSAGLQSQQPRPGGTPNPQNLDIPYAVPNLRVATQALDPTPIRTSNLRAPYKIGNAFASEAFIDELAAAAQIDPVAFRRRGLTDPRALAVIDRATAMFNWKPRPAHTAKSGGQPSGPILTGQGFAYIRYKQAENYVAIAMEVEVTPATGKLTIKRVACAHDCGLIINPDGLRNQVEGNILQTLSRTLHEEVVFDNSRVTSTDWATYPILRFPEAPAIEVALLNHPDQPAWGAGEAAAAPVAAALANAIFDATGVRLRTAPFTAVRVRAALA